jgi:hypothetical protein
MGQHQVKLRQGVATGKGMFKKWKWEEEACCLHICQEVWISATIYAIEEYAGQLRII